MRIISRASIAAPAVLTLLTACGAINDRGIAGPGVTAQTHATPTVQFDPMLCTPQAGAPYGQTAGITGTHVMVTSADVKASAAGCKILARGGSAIDAAIAVQAMLNVTEPFASGLAGGSLITYYDAASKTVHAYDGLSGAPAATGGVPDIYKAALQDVSCKPGLAPGASISSQQGNTNISARAVGVPGTVSVLDLVHRAYGKLAWNQLWDDSISTAANGFPMTPYMYLTLYSDPGKVNEAGRLVSTGTAVPAWANATGTAKGAPRCSYPDIHDRYCLASDPSKQQPLPVGTIIRNADLAATLTQVRDGGAAAFYDPAGRIAPAIVAKITSGQSPCNSQLPAAGTPGAPSVASNPARIPSLMTTADFAAYRAVERKPLIGRRFGLTVYTQPPPSFGGLVTLYNLGLMERKSVGGTAFNGVDYLHLVTEGSRLAGADRRDYVGDPAYSNTDEEVAALLQPSYLDARAGLIGGTALGKVTAGGITDGIPALRPKNPIGYRPLARTDDAPDHAEDWNTTSNLAIVDGYGNALSMTTTINIHWGAHIEAGGMMLNNAMSNFSASLPDLAVNGYAPLARARSSIAPAIAFDSAGKLRLVWGSAGGGPIPDYIVKIFLGNVAYGMDIQAAINAGNFTGQNGGAGVEAGSSIASRVADLIGTYGNTAANAKTAGLSSGQSGIAVNYTGSGTPVYQGAADNRRNGGANGY